MASSAASRTASRCTWSKARATSPISSVEDTAIGSISTLSSEPSVSLSLRTMSGSRVPAMSSASSRSRRSGRIIDRATNVVISRTRMSRTSVMTLMMTADRVADDWSDWLRVTMLPTRLLSTWRILPRVEVMLPYHVPAGSIPAATGPMLTLPLLLVEVATCSSNAAWSTGVPLTVFWNSCCSPSVAELWKSCSAAASWACALCRALRPCGGNWRASSAAYSTPRCSEAWSSARPSAVRVMTSLESWASLVPVPEMLVNVRSVATELV